MFEKFSISDIDSAGRGGEYTVQVSLAVPAIQQRVHADLTGRLRLDKWSSSLDSS